MMSPISPEFQRIIYKAREQELDLAIQRRLAREARGIAEPTKPAAPWYAAVLHWFKSRPRPLRPHSRPTTCESC